jgi:hypothetical protein
MKKIVLVLFVCTALVTSAQKLKDTDVPSNVKEAFKKMYPHAEKATWEKEKGNFEAEFKGPGKNGKQVERSVVLDATGNYVQEEVEIETSDLPAAVNDYVKNSLAGKKIKEACAITLPTGETKYEVEIEKTDYIFDSNGKFLMKETSTDSDMDGKDD